MNRLTKDNYKRPPLTKTDKLTNDNIRDLLEDYNQFTSFKDVPINTHIRYFVNKNGKQLFRTGGFLLNKNGLPDYIVLSSGSKENPKSWSVQTKDTTFFKKISLNELKIEYDGIIDTLEKRINILENIIVSMGGIVPK
jgi:hypothetical protein